MLGYLVGKFVRRAVRRKVFRYYAQQTTHVPKSLKIRTTYKTYPIKNLETTSTEEQEMFDQLDRGVGRKR